MKPPVDQEIYVAVAKAVSREFAFSYLAKAGQYGRTIEPHTHMAWERLRDSYAAMKVFRELKVMLKEPIPYYLGRDEPAPQRNAA